MGLNQSSECCNNSKSVILGNKDEIKQTIYAYYPGLEQQLEMAFSCHNVNDEEKLPYSVLEPVLRHLFMQYGLIEYLTRFCNDNGELDSNYVARDLNMFNVSSRSLCCKAYLTCEDFKSLAVVWLKKILDTYAEDQAEWSKKLREQQLEQSESYIKAMKSFQEQYSTQQALYQQGLESQRQQIQEWNKLLEDTQRTQKEVFEAEVRRMKEIKEKEDNALEIAAKEQRKILQEYTDQITKIAKEDKKGICFAYPSSATPYGACVSAGAQEPTKRRRNRHSHENAVQKDIMGCC